MTLKSVRPQSLEISWRNNNVIGRNFSKKWPNGFKRRLLSLVKKWITGYWKCGANEFASSSFHSRDSLNTNISTLPTFLNIIIFHDQKPKKEGWNFVNFGQNAGIHRSYSKRTEQRTLYRDRILERKSLTGIKRHKDQRILDLIKIKLFVIGSTVSIWPICYGFFEVL